jgi:outer membrane protein assembly factor BamB
MLAATLLAASALAAAPFPETIPVPPGSLPEGIASGKGNTFYAGSRLDGSVYAGDYRTGEGEVVVPGGDGRKAFGLKYEGGKLYVAGGDTGKGFVYDARTGALLDTLEFGGVFVNDVTVTRMAAYFTDSDVSRPFIYRYDRRTGETSALPISGDLEYVAGFNANGIAATPNGKTLIVVQSGTGKLFTADPRTGVTDEITIPAPVTNGDGILLRGKKLYVVRNRDNQIVALRLNAKLTAARSARTLTDPDFDVPTTVAAKGKRLYAINARFGTPNTPTTEYDVVKVG